MNKNIILMYKKILKEGFTAKVERVKDGVYGIALYKREQDAWFDRRFFYLYPENYEGDLFDE